MTRLQAIELISAAVDVKENQVWVDLGCGGGTFTMALASLLSSESVVHAVDIHSQSFPSYINGVQIKFYKADFVENKLPFDQVDGILMANSLHYVAEPLGVIERLSKMLKHGTGKFLLVEYNRRDANQWVPYPIPYDGAVKLFSAIGYNKIVKTGERPSRYGHATIYAITASR